MPAARTTAAAACLFALLTAGCGSSEPDTPPPAVSTSTETVAGSDAPSPSAAAASSVAAAAVDKEVVVTVAKRKVTPPTSRVEVAKGNLVRITVTSDVADELHVHGYDKTLKLPPGTPASIELRVDRTGLFEVETHSSHLVLFQLVVR